jgi:hypothetical protein
MSDQVDAPSMQGPRSTLSRYWVQRRNGCKRETGRSVRARQLALSATSRHLMVATQHPKPALHLMTSRAFKIVRRMGTITPSEIACGRTPIGARRHGASAATAMQGRGNSRDCCRKILQFSPFPSAPLSQVCDCILFCIVGTFCAALAYLNTRGVHPWP